MQKLAILNVPAARKTVAADKPQTVCPAPESRSAKATAGVGNKPVCRFISERPFSCSGNIQKWLIFGIPHDSSEAAIAQVGQFEFFGRDQRGSGFVLQTPN